MEYTSFMEVTVVHILILIVVSVQANQAPRFWDVMKSLEEMNRRSLQQRSSEQHPHRQITTSIPVTTQISVSKFQAVTTDFQTTEKPDVSLGIQTEIPSTAEKDDKHRENSEQIPPSRTAMGHTFHITLPTTTIQAVNNKEKLSSVGNDKTTSPSQKLINSALQSSHDGHHAAKQKTNTDSIHSPFTRDILLYSGVVGGVVFASIFIMIYVIIRRKRLERQAKARFSATDQKTYQDTKIFVMASTEKSDNIVSSFEAIPPNANLWKELQSNTPNVF